jgi:hypothetical protein
MSNELDIFKKAPAKDIYKQDLKDNENLLSDLGSSVQMIKLDTKKLEFSIKKSGNVIGTVKNVTCIIVDAGPVAKRFYETSYDPKATAAPDCASVDGVKPDVSIQCPQSKLCKACTHNQWGSKGKGSKGKACSDYVRLVVCILDDYSDANCDGYQLFRLDVPPGSLSTKIVGKREGKLLPAYKEYLKTNGRPIFAVVTQIDINPDGDYTTLEFKAILELNADVYTTIKSVVKKDPQIQTMIYEQNYESADSGEAVPEIVDETVETVKTKKKPVKPKVSFDLDESDLDAEIDALTRD